MEGGSDKVLCGDNGGSERRVVRSRVWVGRNGTRIRGKGKMLPSSRFPVPKLFLNLNKNLIPKLLDYLTLPQHV